VSRPKSRSGTLGAAVTRTTPGFTPSARTAGPGLARELWAAVTRSTPAFLGTARAGPVRVSPRRESHRRWYGGLVQGRAVWIGIGTVGIAAVLLVAVVAVMHSGHSRAASAAAPASQTAQICVVVLAIFIVAFWRAAFRVLLAAIVVVAVIVFVSGTVALVHP
jgi:hypothetical protein